MQRNSRKVEIWSKKKKQSSSGKLQNFGKEWYEIKLLIKQDEMVIKTERCLRRLSNEPENVGLNWIERENKQRDREIWLWE